MDTSTGAIPKRPRKRKVRAKLSFGSTSTANGSLTYHRQANLTDFVAHLAKTQKGEGYEHQSDPTINATEETGPTTATTIGENREAEQAHNTEPSVGDSQVATSTVANSQSCIEGDNQAVINEKSKGLTETDVLVVARQTQVRLWKDLSHKHGLGQAVSHFDAKLMLETRGIMATCRDTPPGFIVVHEYYLYSFVYYEDPDGEVQGGPSSDVKDEAITGPCPRLVPTTAAAGTRQLAMRLRPHFRRSTNGPRVHQDRNPWPSPTSCPVVGSRQFHRAVGRNDEQLSKVARYSKSRRSNIARHDI
ncbi:hypothetical protein HPB50_002469 [Hyalomma asiaticum]|uniref:Uncharacterized protein n=1 Tax=Hyalomma asiaticum TaxID=266040 RepID=A0ACB7RHW2_HYAAI|nr:hypothetical protein HPB50_002469 [Hyalomma asiaticum]